jgi:RimJ/RimL family protein N-acetyltransferase
MPAHIETERLSLRPRGPEDAPWNLQLLAGHAGGTTATVADERRRLAAQAARATTDGFGLFTIRPLDGAEPIGYCGLIVGRATFDEPELAYELLGPFHGRGFATEAAGAVADAALATGRTRVWASVGSWNAASFRVLEKIRFRRNHTITDDDGEVVFMVREAGV